MVFGKKSGFLIDQEIDLVPQHLGLLSFIWGYGPEGHPALLGDWHLALPPTDALGPI